MNTPPMKITPQEICPRENYTERKQKKKQKYTFFALTKAVQYNILIKITKVLFDTQKISQKILDLHTMKWIQKSNESKNQVEEN